MLPWLADFRLSLDREFDRAPRIAILATVEQAAGAAGGAGAAAEEAAEARARCVVCRDVDVDGNLHFVSDARSDKNAQLRRNPIAEAVFWLTSQRRQYRVRGSVVIDGDSASPRRAAAWASLSDASRALFAWPPPGIDRAADDATFSKALERNVPIPPSFELLILKPAFVELLDLTEHPHRRVQFAAAADWQPRLVNP